LNAVRPTRPFPLLPLLVALVLTVPLGAVGQETGTERLARFTETTRSLTARFLQTVLDENDVMVQRSTGSLSVLKPGRFRWDYYEPYDQQIVSDGEHLWIYDVDLEQVSVKPLDEALGAAPAMLLSSDRPLDEQFLIEELGRLPGGGDLLWVELRPKAQDIDYSRVYLGLDAKTLRQMELRDKFGQRTRIVFEDVQINPDIPAQRFAFEPPPGVDVIGDPR
jgi:outer membrane lipoprotein carrier protein